MSDTLATATSSRHWRVVDLPTCMAGCDWTWFPAHSNASLSIHLITNHKAVRFWKVNPLHLVSCVNVSKGKDKFTTTLAALVRSHHQRWSCRRALIPKLRSRWLAISPLQEEREVERCRVHFMRNVLAHAGRQGWRVVSAFIATAFARNDAEAASALDT